MHVLFERLYLHDLQYCRHYRYLEPIAPFRTTYMYANIPFVIAGLAAEKIGGKLWEDSLKELILDPLGKVLRNLN